MKWPLKLISGDAVAPNVSTNTAGSALQAKIYIHGPWKAGKMEEHVPWDEAGVELA